MANYRVGRVSQEILKEVNDILMNTVRDPRVEGITITDVDLTGDLQQATIFYSTLETDDQTKKKRKLV
jgi:Ribosome-binding factor A